MHFSFREHRETSRHRGSARHGAEGVGLFRTEYLFINRDIMPSEEEQYQAYREGRRGA